MKKKSHSAEKNGGSLWDFSTSILSQNSEKIEGEKIFREKSRNAEKKLKGTLWSRLVLYVTRETFLVQFLGPAATAWRLLEIL